MGLLILQVREMGKGTSTEQNIVDNSFINTCIE